MAKSVLYFTEVCMAGVNELFNNVFHLDHLFVIRHFRNEGNWSRNSSRNCFCIATGDAPVSYWLLFIPVSLRVAAPSP